MTTKTVEICVRCGTVGKNGSMEFDEHANGFVCDLCSLKREICVLSK